MNRSAMRENAFKLIYSIEMQKDNNLEEQIDLFFESNLIEDKEAQDYIKDAVFGIDKNKNEILENIKSNLKEDWKIDRISKVDLSILELAIYEIKYTDTPYKVVINEAVEITKKYSEEKSKSFVNGVLASIVKDM